MTPDKAGRVELHGRIHQTAPLEILGRSIAFEGPVRRMKRA